MFQSNQINRFLNQRICTRCQWNFLYVIIQESSAILKDTYKNKLTRNMDINLEEELSEFIRDPQEALELEEGGPH